MSTTRRVCLPLLVALLVALLAGPGLVSAAEPRLTDSSLMIPAAAFIPGTDDEDYHIFGEYLQSYGTGDFYVPLSFPAAEVSIKRITLYVYDPGEGVACVWLNRSNPATQADTYLGGLCSTDSPDPHAEFTTDISPRRVNTTLQGAYLYVTVPPGIDLFGVRVNFSY